MLGPASYGVWTQMVVAFNYAQHLPLGFQHAMNREAPFYRGQKNWEQEKVVQDISFTIMLGIAVLAVAALIMVQQFFSYSLFKLPGSALMVLGGVVFTQQIYIFYSILMRTQQKFVSFSLGFTLSSLLALVLAVAVASTLGVQGAALAQGTAFLLVALFWHTQSGFAPLNIAFSVQQFKRLSRIAIPLFLVGFTNVLIVSIDRLAVSIFYDESQVGFYGLAFLLNQSIYLIVTPLVQALSPRLMEDYGRYQEPARVSHYLFFMTILIGIGVALLIGVLYLVIGSIIPFFLPHFIPAIETARIRLLGGAYSALVIGANTFLIAMNKQPKLLWFQIGIIILQATCLTFTIKMQGSISQVAGVALFSQMVYAMITFFWACSVARRSSLRALMLCLKTFLPLSYILLLSILFSRWRVEILNNSYLAVSLPLLSWATAALPACFYLLWELRRMTKSVVD